MKKIFLSLVVVAASSLMAADGATLFQRCAACHGAKAEKHALGRSDVIQGWPKNKIAKRLKYYRDGNLESDEYVMRQQVKNLSNSDIEL